jgi:hypothetical protein
LASRAIRASLVFKETRERPALKGTLGLRDRKATQARLAPRVTRVFRETPALAFRGTPESPEVKVIQEPKEIPEPGFRGILEPLARKVTLALRGIRARGPVSAVTLSRIHFPRLLQTPIRGRVYYDIITQPQLAPPRFMQTTKTPMS